MNKPTKRTVSVKTLVSKTAINVREENNYDLDAICQQIVMAGRIHTSMMAEEVEGELWVLQGHRRTRGGQRLLADHNLIATILLNMADNEKDPEKRDNIKKNLPDMVATIVENLGKVEVSVYKGLSEEERLTLILDHGSMKPISRTEVVNTVWRMDKSFFSEGDIIRIAYFSLADFTGNKRKLSEVPQETKAREAYLRKWLHGTVGNFILSAARMGDYVREQFMLTHRAEDNLLREGEKVEMKCTRDRITQLSAAKTKDKDVWTSEEGGPEFNALIAKFKAEDAGAIDKEVKKRLTPKELNDKADVYQSKAIKKALWIAAGETGDKVQGLLDDDARMYRDEQAMALLAEYWAKMPKDAHHFDVQAFVTAILHNTKGKLAEFLTAISVEEPKV